MYHRDFTAVAALIISLNALPATLPIRFEPNVGQAPSEVRYLARLSGYDDVLFAEQGAVVSLLAGPSNATAPLSRAPLRLSLAHARAHPELLAERPQRSVSNYFIGSDPARWHNRVANFGALRYRQVYPGIDWVLYGNPQRLEYDFVVAPGANPRRIRVNVEGADRISVASDGALLITTGGRTLRQLKPVVYQTAADGTRSDVAGRYLAGRRHFAFALGAYDHRRALIIDPAFIYSTYLGGNGDDGDGANAIAVDGAGNAYVAGVTSSSNFPTVDPFQKTNHGTAAFHNNAFVSKLNADGSGLIWSTYLGGSGDKSFDGDGATGIAVDADGNAYVTGYTGSSDFPTRNAFQSVNKSTRQFYGTQAFVTKLDATGSALVYSTYLGGTGADSAAAIAIDAAGDAYVAGTTSSIDFPTANALQATNRVAFAGAIPTDAYTGFVAKFDPSGGALVYSTYLGGSGTKSFDGGDSVNAIAVDAAGNAYLAGTTASTDFPLARPFQAVNKASYNAFVTKLSASGRSLVYSTYLGGSTPESNCLGCGSTWADAIAVDAAGEAAVAGITVSADFPTVKPFQAANRAGNFGTAYVTKFNAAGDALVYSTYLGGSGGEVATAIALDSGANAYVAGSTSSADFPLGNPLQATNHAAIHGAANAFVSVLEADGSELRMSTYLGGSGRPGESQPACSCPLVYSGDGATGVAIDGTGNVYVAGTAYSSDFPIVNPLQATNRAYATSGSNAFVTRLNSLPGPNGGGALDWGSLALLMLALLAKGCGARLRPARLR
jgi:hypothetical protein